MIFYLHEVNLNAIFQNLIDCVISLQGYINSSDSFL